MSGPEIISRKDALARGLKRYCTGAACAHGHVDSRFTANSNCVECVYLRNAAHNRNNRPYYRARASAHQRKVGNLIAVLRVEMPELLKEFGL